MAERSEMALRLPADAVEEMRRGIGGVAELVIGAVITQVPSYRDPFRGQMGRNIEVAVKTALDGFLDLAARREGIDAGDQIETVLEAAYALGRGEARSGRSMDALAQAYRVGARVAWREMSTAAVASGLDPETLARLAELVFAYIDELSDASVSGHADELTTSGRLRQRRLDRLALRLVEGAPEEELISASERADWEPPAELTALIAPDSAIRAARAQLDGRSLLLGEELAELDPGWGAVLAPTPTKRARASVVRAARGTEAVIGPSQPWITVRASYLRALQAHRLGLTGDTGQHLAPIALSADPGAIADLRARVLEPLAGQSPASREKLTATLRAWLLHQGRRDDVAAALFVHPQTVRYRVGQLREFYGDQLRDPLFVRDAIVALG